MQKQYRQGAVGALMDEYERAAADFEHCLRSSSVEDFRRLLNPNSPDPDCQSIQSICLHVVGSGYTYANYISRQFDEVPTSLRNTLPIDCPDSASAALRQMLAYTLQVLENKWALSEKEVIGNLIQTAWGQQYDFEQMMEHAIVHLLRHRRQIEIFLLKAKQSPNS